MLFFDTISGGFRNAANTNGYARNLGSEVGEIIVVAKSKKLCSSFQKRIDFAYGASLGYKIKAIPLSNIA